MVSAARSRWISNSSLLCPVGTKAVNNQWVTDVGNRGMRGWRAASGIRGPRRRSIGTLLAELYSVLRTDYSITATWPSYNGHAESDSIENETTCEIYMEAETSLPWALEPRKRGLRRSPPTACQVGSFMRALRSRFISHPVDTHQASQQNPVETDTPRSRGIGRHHRNAICKPRAASRRANLPL